jgi:hypothetical protein
MTTWVNDPNDERLHAPARGRAGGSIASGGWRCAGAMGYHGFDVPDHVISVPFLVVDSRDPRHNCYCVACAMKFLGVSP